MVAGQMPGLGLWGGSVAVGTAASRAKGCLGVSGYGSDTTELSNVSQPRTRIVIIGGGPGGYEAALVAAQLGARVTVIEDNGLGGACVLTDCVPSKTLIATQA